MTEEKAPYVADRPYSHYFRDVSNLTWIDIYRVLELYQVTDHALGHAVKKLLAAGLRNGLKDYDQDVREARDTLNRWLDMRLEGRNPLLSTDDVADDLAAAEAQATRTEQWTAPVLHHGTVYGVTGATREEALRRQDVVIAQLEGSPYPPFPQQPRRS